jgi:hypothetical protein
MICISILCCVFVVVNRDVLFFPERHSGVWHTCNDPALKGKWHWSCCDVQDKKADCTANGAFLERKKEMQRNHPYGWAVLVSVATFGRARQ